MNYPYLRLTLLGTMGVDRDEQDCSFRGQASLTNSYTSFKAPSHVLSFRKLSQSSEEAGPDYMGWDWPLCFHLAQKDGSTFRHSLVLGPFIP